MTTETIVESGHLQPLMRLSRDLRASARTLSAGEARFLVASYYQFQDDRIRDMAQLRRLEETGEPHDVLNWLSDQNKLLEQQLKGALDRYSAGHPVGVWMRGVDGIGPVIAAGLLAHIDIHKAMYAGQIWRFAGQNPEDKKEKGKKLVWNAQLKTLCWKIGESFVKVSGKDSATYGKAYAARKEVEIAKNENGEYAEAAARILTEKNWGKTTDAYKHYSSGKLPPAHIHARAKRFAVKLFLSHLHTVWYWLEFGKVPPVPYVLTKDGHNKYIPPCNLDQLPDLAEALKAQGISL